MKVSLIVARAQNGCIGRNNKLPWYLPGDLKYFKQITFGKPVVMGRKTWESLKGPLPGRTNIVITRQTDYVVEGAKVVSSLEEAVALAESIAVIDGSEEVIIMGGAQIYAKALPRCDRAYITEVHAEIEGDAFFPALNAKQWKEIGREDFVAEGPNPYDYSFVVYEKS